MTASTVAIEVAFRPAGRWLFALTGCAIAVRVGSRPWSLSRGCTVSVSPRWLAWPVRFFAWPKFRDAWRLARPEWQPR